MGVRHQVQAQGLVYTVVDDLQIVYQALITGSLVDEVSGGPLLVDAAVIADVPGVGVNVTDGGLFAATGYVDRVFPKLATTAYTVHLNIVATGYRPAAITVPVPTGSVLPIALAAPLKMRPLPVRLQGRVVRVSDRSAIGGATVTSKTAGALILRSPFYFGHAAGVTVNAFAFPPAGAARTLASAVNGGSSTVTLNSIAGLAAAQVLQIGADPLAELAIIQSLGPGAAQVNLQYALNSTFPANAQVQQVTPTGPSGSATLARSSDVGDGLLVLSGPLAAAGVQIADGAQTEYHLLNAVADAGGYYHANGVAGVVLLNLQASAGGFSPGTASWTIFYNDPVNVVDFRLKP